MFAVPVLEWAESLDESADIKKVYAMVDRLSYLDWGLRTDDEVSGKRVAAKQRDTWDGARARRRPSAAAAHRVAASGIARVVIP